MRPIGLTARIRAALATGDMTRAEIAAHCGVTADRVGNLLQNLLYKGDIRVIDRKRSPASGPRNVYSLCAGVDATMRGFDDTALREAMRAWHG